MRKHKIIEVYDRGRNNGIWQRPHKCPYCKEHFRHWLAVAPHITHKHDLERRLDPEVAEPFFRSLKYSRSETERRDKRKWLSKK